MEQVKENGKMVSILGFQDFEDPESGILIKGYEFFFKVQEIILVGLYETDEVRIASLKYKHLQEEVTSALKKYFSQRK